MVSLTIELDAEKALLALPHGPKRVARSTARALNRALTTGRAEMASLISKDMGIRSRDAKDAIRAEEATPQKLQVRMLASLKRLPLHDFKPSGPIPSRGKGRGVAYRIGSRGRGRVEDAFIATMRSNHTGVFKRAGKARLPIIELFGPSIGRVFEQHRPSVTETIKAAFNARLDHELRFAFTEPLRA